MLCSADRVSDSARGLRGGGGRLLPGRVERHGPQRPRRCKRSENKETPACQIWNPTCRKKYLPANSENKPTCHTVFGTRLANSSLLPLQIFSQESVWQKWYHKEPKLSSRCALWTLFGGALKPSKAYLYFEVPERSMQCVFDTIREPLNKPFPLQERCPPRQKSRVGRLQAKVEPLSIVGISGKRSPRNTNL